jgi:type IV pilus assembly protein PilC
MKEADAATPSLGPTWAQNLLHHPVRSLKMPAFVWKGKTRDGKAVSGERVADSKEAVMALLRRDQILVSSVKEKGKEIALPKLGGGVPAKDLAIFTRQFSVMIDAGLPLVQCLEILGGQQENKNFARILQQTRMDVEGGASLADAMRKHPKAFDDLFTNMIAAGEAGGILDTILKRLATYIEKAVKLQAQVKGAMVYPVAVISIAGIVIAVILWKVIPTFASMFAGLGAELPLPTRIVIAMSQWFVRLLPFLVVFIVLGVVAFRRYYATYGGRRVIDRIVLKLPILGVIMQKIAVARFCRTLSTLISSGVPILDGLEITARTAGNAIIEDAIMAVRKAVESGLTVAQPLKESGVFPPMVVQMIGVGEQTGALDAMLSKIADFYEEEVDQAVANLLTLMEPVMIMFLGVTVGGIVISMYLPLFDLISKLS